MKTHLTHEQSQRLIELGVAPSKASGFEEVDITDLTDPNAFIKTEYHRFFTLSDCLSLLPKEIKVDGITYNLNIDYPPICQVAARYIDGDGDSLKGMMCTELIDALFELLCWVLQNHPDKIKRI